MSGLFSLLKSILQSLTRRSGGSATPASPPASSPASSGKTPSTLAWGAKVSAEFRDRVVEICGGLDIEPSWLMACMAFESAETFRPDVRNAAGSGATGLIQFMPLTARALGTTTTALASMTAVQQLDYVERYFQPYAGRLHALSDVYAAILWPAAVGKPKDYVLFERPSVAYTQNAGLDADKDGRITKAEAASLVAAKLRDGLQSGNVWSAS